MNTPPDLPAWRKSERARLLAQRESIALDVRREWSAAITARLCSAFDALEGRRIGFCWPFRAEPDPRFFVREMRLRGARAALPVVIERKGPLQFLEWWPGVATSAGVFDLPVPVGTEVIRPDALLVPPVGFDARGYRLGYGGGYFDRTLAAMSPQPLKVGVAFELARIATIHPQPFDIPMDFIVTEQAIYRAQEGELRPTGNAAVREAAQQILIERAAASLP